MLEATSFFDADALKGRMSPQVGEKRPHFGRAEVTREGLAFPNRPSREPLAPRMSEPEQNKRRGQRGGKRLPGFG
jgi:hypothetical protein